MLALTTPLNPGNEEFGAHMLKHGDGKISTYAHLNSIDVKPDAIVTAGSKIGTVGSTGGVTQPQLNLQIRGIDKQPIDPSSLIPELG